MFMSTCRGPLPANGRADSCSVVDVHDDGNDDDGGSGRFDCDHG